MAGEVRAADQGANGSGARAGSANADGRNGSGTRTGNGTSGQAPPRRRVSGFRRAVAIGLVLCYAGACAWSLWNRAHAIEFFAVASLAAVGFIVTGVLPRLILGLAVDGVAVLLGTLLPGLGDIIDALAALVVIALTLDKYKRFGRNLLNAAGCFALYALLWEAAERLPRGLAVNGHGRGVAAHGTLFDLGVALGAALVGVAVLAGFVGLAALTRQERTRAVFFTVGYPWYLAVFAITLFLPDAVSAAADLDLG